MIKKAPPRGKKQVSLKLLPSSFKEITGKKYFLILYVLSIFMFINTPLNAQLISATATASNINICEGDSTTLLLKLETFGTPQLQVNWVPSVYMNCDTLDSPTVKPKQTTTYQATISDIENHISVTTFVTISVIPKPIVKAPDNIWACSNQSVLLSPLKFENSQQVYWSHNGNGSFYPSPDSLNVTYLPGENELSEVCIVLTGKGIDYCKNVSDSTTIIFSNPTTSDIINSDTILCSNQQLQLTGILKNAGSYLWKHNGKGKLENANTLNPTYVPHENESGQVYIMLEAFGPVCNYSDTVKLDISLIFVEFNQEVFACEGDKVVLSVVTSPSSYCAWNTGQLGNQIQVNALFSQIYVATITNPDNCTSEASILLETYEKPSVAISADMENKLLTAFPAGLHKYEFYDNNDKLLYSGTSNVFDYSSLLSEAKSIYVIAYNEFDCSSDKESTGNDNNFILPATDWVNAFSPNNDGINDRLLPGRFTKVFDRTSKILYEGREGWDGTFNGKKMPEGTYFYILYNGNEVFYKGPVSILR